MRWIALAIVWVLLSVTIDSSIKNYNTRGHLQAALGVGVLLAATWPFWKRLFCN